MKIAFSGAQCAGKTTSIYDTAATLKQRGFESVEVVPEVARLCPYPINMATTFDTAFWIIRKQMELENQLQKTEILLLDRCVLDALTYWKYTIGVKLVRGEKIPDELMATSTIHDQNGLITRLATLWLDYSPIDLLLFFKPRKLIADNVRSMDETFQEGIDKMMKNVIKVYGRRPRIKSIQHVITSRIKPTVCLCEDARDIVYEFVRNAR